MPLKRHPFSHATHIASLTRIPLDLALVARLRDSFKLIQQHDTRLASIFYTRLFEMAPSLRPLFRTAPEEQQRKLMRALEAVIDNIEKPGANAAMLAELGRRHAQYGATPRDYPIVTSLLVESIKQLLGHAIDHQTLREWDAALRLIADQMCAAAATPTSSTPPTTPHQSRGAHHA